MATYLSEAAADWLERWSKEGTVLHATFDAASRLAMGIGTLATTLRSRPSIVKTVARKVLYSVVTRGIPIAVLLVGKQAVPEDGWADKTIDGALWTQGALATLDVVLIGVWIQRDLGERVTPRCHNVDNALQQTITHLVTPTALGAVSLLLYGPAAWAALPVQGVALGCQIHDAALATRGLCPKHRLARWARDGPMYIMIGVAVAAAGERSPWMLSGVITQGLCNVLSAAATCQPIPKCAGSDAWVNLPYGMSHQLIERARRVAVSGALAPSLTTKTPIAVVVLRAYTRMQWVRRMLPMGLIQPEIHYMIGELITADLVEETLESIHALLSASNSPLKRLSTKRFPVMTAMLTGMPESTVAAVGTVVSDRASIGAIRDIQRQLARRLSEIRADRPLSFAEWDRLGIRPDAIAKWDLNAALSDSTWVDVSEPSIIRPGHWVERGVEAF